MSWRIHLSNQAIQDLQVVNAKEPILCAWTRNDRVHYFDLGTGASLGEEILNLPEKTVSDGEFLQEHFPYFLGGYDDIVHPVMRFTDQVVYTTRDGNIRLSRIISPPILNLAIHDQTFELDTQGARHFPAFAFDHKFGNSAGINQDGKLHIYRQEEFLGIVDIGLQLEQELQPSLCIREGGSLIFASDGRQVKEVNLNGYIENEYEAYYLIDELACSPNGELLIASDSETGVIRVHRSADFKVLYQRFHVDLIAHATQMQLFEELPTLSVSIDNLRAFGNDSFAFSMAGVICVFESSDMENVI